MHRGEPGWRHNVLELLQKGVPGQRRRGEIIDGPRHGRAYRVEIGPRPEEASTVRGILHRVGEGNQFLVVVEGAGPALRHDLGAQGGIAGTQQDLPVALAAGRTGAVVPGKRGVAAGAAARAGGAKRCHQLVMAAGLAAARVGLQIATGAAHVLWHPGDVWRAPLDPRIQAHGLTAPAEPGVVDLVQAVGQLVAGRCQARQPAGGMALAALNEGQIQPIGVGLEVFIGTQLHPGRVGGDLAHHAAQLPHPHLHAQRHQWHLPTRGQGPGHQRQQGIEHQPDVRAR